MGPTPEQLPQRGLAMGFCVQRHEQVKPPAAPKTAQQVRKLQKQELIEIAAEQAD